MNLSLSSEMTYVALAATILPADLQVHASAAGLCHVRVTDYTLAQQCLVQVAALPHRLDDTACQRVFTLWVDAEQLTYLLPWDRDLQYLPTCEVRERLQAQTLSVTGDLALPCGPASLEDQEPSEPTVPDQRDTDQAHQALTLIPLPELFISCTTVNETVTEAGEPSPGGSPSRLTSWTRLVWLRAALAMVRRQMEHRRQMFFKLDVLLDKVIAAQRCLRQSLVSACPVHIGNRLVGWRLQIALPLREVLA